MVSTVLPYIMSMLYLMSNLMTAENSTIVETTSGELSTPNLASTEYSSIVKMTIGELSTPNLVTARNSSSVETTTEAIEGAPLSLVQVLPPGYVIHSDLGVAYKVHNRTVSWNVARDRCAREGAFLASIDSAAKIELVRKHEPAKRRFVHVGFHLKDGDDDNWYSVSTGLPVSNLPWASGEPRGSGRCAATYSSQVGLGKFTCANSEVYVCQILYP